MRAQPFAVLAAGGPLLGGCALIDSWTGTWHAADEGPVARVAIEQPKDGNGALYFCAADGWREVKAHETGVPAGRPLKLKAVAQKAAHLRHGVEHPERECTEALEFVPAAGAAYRIVWNRQASNCALIVFRKPADASADWPYEDSVARSDGVCRGPNRND